MSVSLLEHAGDSPQHNEPHLIDARIVIAFDVAIQKGNSLFPFFRSCDVTRIHEFGRDLTAEELNSPDFLKHIGHSKEIARYCLVAHPVYTNDELTQKGLAVGCAADGIDAWHTRFFSREEETQDSSFMRKRHPRMRINR